MESSLLVKMFTLMYIYQKKVTFDLLIFRPAGHLQQLESLGVLESDDLHCLDLKYCSPRDPRWYSSLKSMFCCSLLTYFSFL